MEEVLTMAAASARRPNLLFLMTDHQRADSPGMVQAGVEVTPHLNRLASRSTVFTRAYTACPLCVPARTALATGLYPTRTGVVHNDWKGATAGDFKPIHEYLAEAGYEVGHVGVHHIRVAPPVEQRVCFSKWVDPRHHARHLEGLGIDPEPPEGIEAFKRKVVDRADGRPTEQHYSNARAGVWPHPAEHFLDSYLAQEAVEFLRHVRSRPFALFVCLWAPHPPLRVPEPYASTFHPDALDLPGNVGVPASGEPPGRRQAVAAQLAEGVSMEQWRRAWAAHLGLVNLADAAIGSILEALSASGRAPNTIVCFTADHGEHLGQHRMYQKMEMYEPALRVPMLIRAPGGRAARSDVPVSHLDVVPTLLELLKLEADLPLDGMSLAPCVLRGTPPPERPVFALFNGNVGVAFPRRAVVTRRYKYVCAPEEGRELYDLADDPLEMNNLDGHPSHRDVEERLHEECRAWGKAHGDRVELREL